MTRPQPIAPPADMTVESKCLLICLVNNFCAIYSAQIGFALEPYTSQAKAIMDNTPVQLGITSATFESTMMRLAYKIDEKNVSSFLQSMSKALAQSIKSHQSAYCRYLIQEMAWLIWKAGHSIPVREEQLYSGMNNDMFIYF